MHFTALVLFLITLAFGQAITTGQLGNATAVCDNPPTSYVATLGSGNTTGITGSIIGSGNINGAGVNFFVELDNLPDFDTYGPFLYHIHASPIDSSGNCTTALGHLDPFIRGETPSCDAAFPETCQVGDLSGKYGTINSSAVFMDSYTDLFASTKEGLGAFFGNRSFVVHAANKTRLACANFTLDSNGSVSIGAGLLSPSATVLSLPAACQTAAGNASTAASLSGSSSAAATGTSGASSSATAATSTYTSTETMAATGSSSESAGSAASASASATNAASSGATTAHSNTSELAVLGLTLAYAGVMALMVRFIAGA